MRKLLGLCLAALATLALSSYGLWTTQRPPGHYLSDLRISLAINQGQPAGRGNLLGVEARLYPTDYQDLQRLHRKLAAWLQQARELGLINDKTVVVLPEHIGTWLFATGEKNQFYQADSVDAAMHWLAWSNPLQFSLALLQARGEQRLNDAQLRMKAHSMARDYQQLFGGLAKEFGVTLVAGSIVLPAPRIENGQLTVGTGPLYNVTLVFGRDGQPLGQPQRQLHPGHHQRSYIAAGDSSPMQVFDTPAGRLGVLIGSDSWHPDHDQRLAQSNADLLAVPAFVPARRPSNQDWQLRALSEHTPLNTTRAGITVFMRGQFWDQGSSGSSFVHPHEAAQTAATDGARLINLWL